LTGIPAVIGWMIGERTRVTNSNSFFGRESSMNMKVLMTFAILFSLSFPAAAQEPNRSKGQGYLLFAPGVNNIGPGSAALQIGGGGEGFVYRGLGLGIEILAVGTDGVVGLGSANFSYHLLPRTTDRKLEPFVTAGYSMFFRHGIPPP